MKTYLSQPEDGLEVKHDVDKVYITYTSDPFNGGSDMQIILLNEEIDAVIDALKRIRFDIQRSKQEQLERKKLAVWNAIIK